MRGTVENYLRDAGRFIAFLSERDEVTREDVTAWRDALVGEVGCAATTVNRMVEAVNAPLRLPGLDDLCVMTLRLQRRAWESGAYSNIFFSSPRGRMCAM